MRGTIWIVVVLFVLVGIAYGVGGSQVHDVAGEDRTAIEEHTLDTETASTLDAASEWTRMYENETVTSNGTELERGTDYEIDHETGELWAADATHDGETVTVEYAYQRHDETTNGIVAALGPLNVVLGLLALAAAVGTLYNWFGRW